MKIAVVGAGPSGFYAISTLLKQKDREFSIDIFDRLPTPFGLVRGGVAPDHQNIKRITRAYERSMKKENVRFFGNITLGKDVLVSELEEHYHAIIYATGNESSRKLGIPGEDLEGVHSATEFVFWYNGHPDYRDHQFRLEDGKRIVVIGNGNVSIDVARVLAKSADELATTDIADHALEKLRQCPLQDILMLGRRGPAQAAFSPKEIEELAEVNGTDLVVSQRYMKLGRDEHSLEWLQSAPPSAHRNMELLDEQSEKGEGTQARKIRCWFLTSPTEFIGDESGRLRQVRMVRNRLIKRDGRIRPVATEETWVEDVQLVFKAIGYRGVPIPGVPFDDWKGIIPNQEGRVLDGDSVKTGHYVVGWAKRGPSGLIGTNRPDSEATVLKLIEDSSRLQNRVIDNDFVDLIRSKGLRAVSSEDWFKLDEIEQQRGVAKGKVRDKFLALEDVFSALDG